MLAWLKNGLAAALLFASGGAVAQDDESGFQAYLQTLRAEAIAAGVRLGTVDAVLPTLTLDPQTIRNDRAQPAPVSTTTFSPFAPYKAAHVDAARIGGGRRVYARQQSRLAEIERRTGVPAAIALAIYGHESAYGAVTGRYDLFRSLATLAYEGRRRSLFAGEFIAALKMLERGVPREKMRGSWAGAFGGPQFLPSVYLRLARDGDGDGFADLWTSEVDTLTSIGAYLQDAGWRAGEPWGLAVSVPAGFDRISMRTRLVAPRCPRVFVRHSGWRSMAEWRAAGIVPQGARWPADRVLATLIEPDGEGATAYLLTSNYRAILDYNCSNFYALSVGLLADAVAP
ncbi:lytic murein transglycosylase [Sphingomonas sp.]|jgi:lytic murein transglycosylase|uniref:lytic murein transglycosylase n=1 Tax=Sphingomonas sp. TaxID=28214 RepID=UPI002D80FDB0|nr:lytic murein transglycosylase [Sphingomonas sp.]HEU0044765.1 lytic murein transglycosylase [Sphingomonas sp.]